MSIKRFEEIDAWKSARELVLQVYNAINMNKKFQSDFRLTNQIQ
ncbi:MAG: four helix bundle protein, partial [Deltaproteobacteria bacterium]